jgi:hypothetical protein
VTFAQLELQEMKNVFHAGKTTLNSKMDVSKHVPQVSLHTQSTWHASNVHQTVKAVSGFTIAIASNAKIWLWLLKMGFACKSVHQDMLRMGIAWETMNVSIKGADCAVPQDSVTNVCPITQESLPANGNNCCRNFSWFSLLHHLLCMLWYQRP